MERGRDVERERERLENETRERERGKEGEGERGREEERQSGSLGSPNAGTPRAHSLYSYCKPKSSELFVRFLFASSSP